MTDKNVMQSANKVARMTGILYFLVILLGVAIEIMVHNFIFVPGDIATTVNQITSYGSIFRLGFVISLTRFAVFILLFNSFNQVIGGYLDVSRFPYYLANIDVGIVGHFFMVENLLPASDTFIQMAIKHEIAKKTAMNY